jgi:hypothetical protein
MFSGCIRKQFCFDWKSHRLTSSDGHQFSPVCYVDDIANEQCLYILEQAIESALGQLHKALLPIQVIAISLWKEEQMTSVLGILNIKSIKRIPIPSGVNYMYIIYPKTVGYTVHVLWGIDICLPICAKLTPVSFPGSCNLLSLTHKWYSQQLVLTTGRYRQAIHLQGMSLSRTGFQACVFGICSVCTHFTVLDRQFFEVTNTKLPTPNPPCSRQFLHISTNHHWFCKFLSDIKL